MPLDVLILDITNASYSFKCLKTVCIGIIDKELYRSMRPDQ